MPQSIGKQVPRIQHHLGFFEPEQRSDASFDAGQDKGFKEKPIGPANCSITRVETQSGSIDETIT